MKLLCINKQFNLYSLRHSSIQKYTDLYKGDIAKLALRYGWAFNSAPMRLKDYLARSRIALPDGQELRRTDEVERLNKSYEDKIKLMEEAFNKVFKALREKGVKI